MQASECRPLFITRVSHRRSLADTTGIPGVVSHWKPSAEELFLLNTGAPVYLSFLGQTHPPVMVGVQGDGALPL
jgi:hypothetical protein